MSLSSLFSALIDRFRAWRSPTARAAIERQEVYLEGKPVEARRWETNDTPEGPVPTRVATLPPAAETVEPLSAEATEAIAQASAMTLRFVHDHVRGFDAPHWSLQDLDDAFAGWTAHGDKQHCPPDAVVQIVGAAFGEHCIRTLGMRWVTVHDADGTDVAIEGAGDGERYETMRSFPFAAVGKRIDSGESGFLVAMYRVLQGQMG